MVRSAVSTSSNSCRESRPAKSPSRTGSIATVCSTITRVVLPPEFDLGAEERAEALVDVGATSRVDR